MVDYIFFLTLKIIEHFISESIKVNISLEKSKKKLLQEAGKIIRSKSGWSPQFFYD
jgi:hypothetical protein